MLLEVRADQLIPHMNNIVEVPEFKLVLQNNPFLIIDGSLHNEPTMLWIFRSISRFAENYPSFCMRLLDLFEEH